jgi:hypothetical protein
MMSGLKVQSPVEFERQAGTGQLYVRDRSLSYFGGVRCAPHAEERIIAATREVGQLPAGERNAIDFLKRICKECNARNRRH